jgi:hypothetical protein
MSAQPGSARQSEPKKIASSPAHPVGVNTRVRHANPALTQNAARWHTRDVSWRATDVNHVVRLLMASPMSLAPMIRHRTAMMTALCRLIQSLSPARSLSERAPMAK